MTITLHGSVAEMVQEQISTGSYQSAEDLVYEALEALVKHKIDEGINEGIADIETGRCMELRHDNIEEVLSKPISQW
ncbi:hypothetical protein SPONN_2492 [uncultured Candidatus Thioglobus sp.]|nr:hypothetical protein SPONN_2492 [uncultured Candidatus Thioglobus sp.]